MNILAQTSLDGRFNCSPGGNSRTWNHHDKEMSSLKDLGTFCQTAWQKAVSSTPEGIGACLLPFQVHWVPSSPKQYPWEQGTGLSECRTMDSLTLTHGHYSSCETYCTPFTPPPTGSSLITSSPYQFSTFDQRTVDCVWGFLLQMKVLFPLTKYQNIPGLVASASSILFLIPPYLKYLPKVNLMIFYI